MNSALNDNILGTRMRLADVIQLQHERGQRTDWGAKLDAAFDLHAERALTLLQQHEDWKWRDTVNHLPWRGELPELDQ
jgi:hypothetical protein